MSDRSNLSDIIIFIIIIGVVVVDQRVLCESSDPSSSHPVERRDGLPLGTEDEGAPTSPPGRHPVVLMMSEQSLARITDTPTLYIPERHVNGSR